jgi:thiol-disulfide isomerase/thioredoxin
MPKSARFAVSFLSLLLALSVSAADLPDLADARGIDAAFPAGAKLRMVNVWATWCGPCVAEMPDLQAIDDAFGRELAILGISMDDSVPGIEKSRVTAFLAKQKIRFANLYYTGTPEKLGEHLDFSGEIPVTIIFDRKGKELWRHQGRIDKEKTIAVIRDLLRRKS